MGKLLFFVCALIFVVGIFKCRGTNRLIWFFTGMFFFQERIILIESPTVVSFHRILIYSLVASELLFRKNILSQIKSFPILKPLLIVLLGELCIGIFDVRHSIFLNIYRILDDYIQSFFIIIVCYWGFQNDKSWEKFIKYILNISIVISLYGIYNYITKSNPYDDFITKTYNSWSASDIYGQIFSERFRINSFVSTPIYYGYLCSVFLIIGVYSFYNIKPLRRLCLISAPLSFLNLILSNSRTPILAFSVGVVIFSLAGLESKRKLSFFFTIVILSVGLYNIPIIQEKVNSTLEIFKTSEGKTSGSSLEMRTNQLTASYREFLKAPIFGNGFYYINENLGWSKKPEERIRDDDFEGFESYIYHLLIEQGIVGILINALFFLCIGIYFIKKRAFFKDISALGLAILGMFLTFIIGTGTVNSWIISMGLIGILIKYIEQTTKSKAISIPNNINRSPSIDLHKS